MPTAVVTTRGRQASLAILTEGYTPAGPVTMILIRQGHDFQQETDTVANVAGDEINATGYARQAVSFDPPVTSDDGTVTQQSQDLSFGLVGGFVDASVAGCYLFENSGNDATSIITACVEFADAKDTNGTELIVRAITWAWSPTPF